MASAEQAGGYPVAHNALFWGPVAFITASLFNVTFDLWLGLHASQKDFQWVEPGPLLYANWAPGEPSGPNPAPSGNIPVRKPSPLPLATHPLPRRPSLPSLPGSPLFQLFADSAFWGQWHKVEAAAGALLSSSFPPDQLCGGAAQPLISLHWPLG